MKRGTLLALFVCSFTYATMAQDVLWSNVQKETARAFAERKNNELPQEFRLVKLNRSLSGSLQQQAPHENARTNKNVVPVQFDIPLPEGIQVARSLFESPILSADMQSQYSHIKTYTLSDPVTKNMSGRLTITPDGITGLIFTKAGNVYISPLGKEFPDVHMVYYVKDLKSMKALTCGVEEEISNQRFTSPLAGDCQLRTYRLAVAATGEYTAWAGSQANAIGYITTAVNNVDAIYERDANIRFTLVTNNSIIFTDAGTDPYTTSASPTTTTLNENNTTLNTNITSANYDLGIVFNDGWNGGLAQLSSVCGASKGRSAAGLDFGTGSNPTAGPQGPVFEGTVAHEIAHQFSATHTMAATNGGCSGNTTASSAWEPGGGSTIMAYAGVCSGNSYQNNSDLYFHGGNISQILSFAIATGTCSVNSSTGNNAPTVSVTATTYTIPVSTPFTLTATGSDADGNTLSYAWEQLDAGFTTASPPLATNASGPNFRSYFPTTESSRTFPRIDDIIAGVSPTYEVLPSVTRTMNFQVMVRDEAAGGGCTDEETVAVTTDAGAGPFVVTSQTTPETWPANGSNTVAITWNVANTTAAPVNCAAVDILFSIDGGYTYPYTLLAGTPNDGSEMITIPNLPTSVGRVKVQAAGNIFFNINDANITITSSCSAEGATVTPATTVTNNAGNAALDLTLSPLYGSVVTPTGTLESTDTDGFLAVNNLAVGSCAAFGNSFRHDTYRFTVNVAGSYTFTRSGGTSGLTIFNLYTNSFDPSDPCSNFIISNGTFNGSSINVSSNFSTTLTPGIFYVLAVGTFNSSQPALPSAYTINVTPPGGGNIFDATPDPGAGFDYTYVIVNNATGNIVAIDANADLSNSGTFGSGNYTVYGLSYSSSISLATLNTYVGGAFTTLQNDALFNPSTLCSNLSKNSVAVTILASLPVQLQPLQAQKAGSDVLLTWATLSEQNSSHFEIWRSQDGNSFDKLVGTVSAQGNSANRIDYSLVDHEPMQSVNYYRLKQFDLDGKSTLSNIASVNMTPVFTRTMVYPNPAKTSVQLVYMAAATENVQVQLLDSKGALVARSAFMSQAGQNIRSFNVAALAKGVYAFKVISSSGTVISRFIKE